MCAAVLKHLRTICARLWRQIFNIHTSQKFLPPPGEMPTTIQNSGPPSQYGINAKEKKTHPRTTVELMKWVFPCLSLPAHAKGPDFPPPDTENCITSMTFYLPLLDALNPPDIKYMYTTYYPLFFITGQINTILPQMQGDISKLIF